MTTSSSTWQSVNSYLSSTAPNQLNQYNFFELRPYKLIYNTNGDTAFPEESIKYTAPLDSYDPGEPTRTDHEFIGWFEDPDFMIPFGTFAGKKMPGKNLILYAKWRSTDCTITFLNKEGSEVLGTDGAANGGTIAKPNNYQENKAYPGLGVFLGWGSRTYWGLQTHYAWEDAVYGNTTLYGLWHKVTYEGGGNTGGTVPIDSGVYALNTNAVATTPDDTFTKSGYIFAGWLDESTGNLYYPGMPIPMYDNITLKARWINPASALQLPFYANTTPTNTQKIEQIRATGKTFPLSSIGYGQVWALLSLILAIAGAVIALVLFITIFTKHKKDTDRPRYEEEGDEKEKIAW